MENIFDKRVILQKGIMCIMLKLCLLLRDVKSLLGLAYVWLFFTRVEVKFLNEGKGELEEVVGVKSNSIAGRLISCVFYSFNN